MRVVAGHCEERRRRDEAIPRKGTHLPIFVDETNSADLSPVGGCCEIFENLSIQNRLVRN
jgi:hypothetical protein